MTARSSTFDDVNTAALAAYPGLLSQLFPKGHLCGREFCVGNLQGEPGESLSVNVETGVWKDFATGDKGRDPVSLFASINGFHQVEAKNQLAQLLGLTTNHKRTRRQHRTSKRGTNGKASAANGTNPTNPPPDRHPELGEPTFRHEYTTADGSLIFYHCRFDPPDGKKKFRPLSWCDGRWQWKDPEGLLPLYGLADLDAHPDKPVLLVEGEKTAEVAREILPDFVVVTWPHGGEATGKVDWSPLKGRYVVCWPDADPDGKGTRTMEAASEQMRKVGAKSAAIVRLPEGLPAKWDLGDPLPEG